MDFVQIYDFYRREMIHYRNYAETCFVNLKEYEEQFEEVSEDISNLRKFIFVKNRVLETRNAISQIKATLNGLYIACLREFSQGNFSNFYRLDAKNLQEYATLKF